MEKQHFRASPSSPRGARWSVWRERERERAFEVCVCVCKASRLCQAGGGLLLREATMMAPMARSAAEACADRVALSVQRHGSRLRILVGF